MDPGIEIRNNVKIDKKYYKPDSIINGRIIGRFFERLSQNIFKQSILYYNKHKEITGEGEIPILHWERNVYSTVASAINKITPVHLSEWSFRPSQYNTKQTRRVDFWCLHKDGETGKPVNFFIELKRAWYSLNEQSKEELQSIVKEKIESLLKQTREIKRISPQWEADNAYLGIIIIHGYYQENNEFYTYQDVRENLFTAIDKRTNAQLLTSTWTLPDGTEVQWERDKCRFITIAGLIISKKRNKD